MVAQNVFREHAIQSAFLAKLVITVLKLKREAPNGGLNKPKARLAPDKFIKKENCGLPSLDQPANDNNSATNFTQLITGHIRMYAKIAPT